MRGLSQLLRAGQVTTKWKEVCPQGRTGDPDGTTLFGLSVARLLKGATPGLLNQRNSDDRQQWPQSNHSGGVISTWTLLKSGSSRSPWWWQVIPAGKLFMGIS